jgi:hypothetical protein
LGFDAFVFRELSCVWGVKGDGERFFNNKR